MGAQCSRTHAQHAQRLHEWNPSLCEYYGSVKHSASAALNQCLCVVATIPYMSLDLFLMALVFMLFMSVIELAACCSKLYCTWV